MQGPWEGAESLEASRELGRSLEEQPAQAPPPPPAHPPDPTLSSRTEESCFYHRDN